MSLLPLSRSTPTIRSRRQVSGAHIEPVKGRSQGHQWREQPLVSVVLPVYNHARFLGDSIRSVLAESYPLELIVVDDGSTDNPGEVVRSFSKDKRLRLISQPNKGLPEALNTGFAAATGELMTWTSADNRFKKGAIGALAEFLLDNPKVGLTYANVQLIDESGNPYRDSSYRKQDHSPVDGSVLLLPGSADTLPLMNDNFINSCFMFRRDCSRAVGKHRTECIGFEDYEYWLRMQFLQPFAHFPSELPLYEYRLHKESMTARLETESMLRNQLSSLQAIQRITALVEQPQTLQLNIATGEAPLIEYLCRVWSNVRKHSISSGETSSFNAVPRLEVQTVETSGGRHAVFELATVHSASSDQSASSGAGFAHSTHTQYLSCAPAAMQVSAAGKSGAKLTVCTPLAIPKLLRRARDSNFNAVTRGNTAAASALLFPPDSSAEAEPGECESWKSALLELVQYIDDVCLVLFCENAAQRQTADAVNVTLGTSANLRIIDVTETSIIPFAPTNREHSLLYTLSSVDCVLHLASGRTSPLDWHALQVEAGLAAAAGVALATVFVDVPDANAIELRTGPIWSGAPHVHFTQIAGTRRKPDWKALRKTIGLAAEYPPLHSGLDQWLEQRSEPFERARLLRFLALEILSTSTK